MTVRNRWSDCPSLGRKSAKAGPWKNARSGPAGGRGIRFSTAPCTTTIVIRSPHCAHTARPCSKAGRAAGLSLVLCREFDEGLMAIGMEACVRATKAEGAGIARMMQDPKDVRMLELIPHDVVFV